MRKCTWLGGKIKRLSVFEPGQVPIINKHIFSIVGRLLHWKNVVSLKIKEFEYMYIFERHLLILYKDIF